MSKEKNRGGREVKKPKANKATKPAVAPPGLAALHTPKPPPPKPAPTK